MTRNDDALKDELRTFVEDHPEGWGHREWTRLLAGLQDQGFDTWNADRIGLLLEEERLDHALARLGVPGLGQKRRQALVERFHTLWNLRQASPEDLAALSTIHRSLAERIAEAVR